MKIGLNATFFIPGKLAGIGVYTEQLIRHLVHLAPQHQFILFVSKESENHFRELPLQVATLPTIASFRPLRILAEQCLLPFYVKAMKLDLLHSLGYTTPLTTSCPSIVSIHDMNYYYWPQNFSKASVKMQQFLIPLGAHRSQAIITLSESSKQSLIKVLNIAPTKVSVVYAAYDADRFKIMDLEREPSSRLLGASYGISTPYILSIATSHPHKNLEGLILAYALLVKEHNIKHQLVLVGHKKNANKRIVELIEKLELQHRIVITGFVPDEILPVLYSLADLFIFPSFYEGFGIPLLEAMACGVPVVSSNATSLPEVAGNAALLVNPYDIHDIAEGILKALVDKELAQSLIERGLHRIQAFSWRKTAQETLSVYEQR